jgi:hypothetical protein
MSSLEGQEGHETAAAMPTPTLDILTLADLVPFDHIAQARITSSTHSLLFSCQQSPTRRLPLTSTLKTMTNLTNPPRRLPPLYTILSKLQYNTPATVVYLRH